MSRSVATCLTTLSLSTQVGIGNLSTMRLLDCTLRDGGYYNNWDFPTPLARRYVSGLSAAGIHTIELGFRTLEAEKYLGAFAHTTDNYLESLNLPCGPTYGVMVNAKELVSYHEGPAAAVDHIFANSTNSPVDLVRVATTLHEVTTLETSVRRLVELGYRIGLNLMQIHSLSPHDIEDFGSWATSVGAEVAYFADSFGVLNPSDIDPIVQALKRGFNGPLGCHLHDNRAMAMANTLAAVDAGVSWVDGTIRGMGRGPGNARTEYLAIELSKRGLLEIDLAPLMPVVEQDFAALHEEFKWGTNLHYMLSGTHAVHPTYVQRMLADPRFSPEQIVESIETLGIDGGSSFDLDQAAQDAVRSSGGAPGSWDASGWCKGRPVLILGPGDTIIHRREDLENFVEAHEVTVLNLNLRPIIRPELIDAYVVCNPSRARLDDVLVESNDRVVFAPTGIMGGLLDKFDVRDWGMSIKTGQFDTSGTECTIPTGLVAAYAIALATEGGASRILLAGLDGFTHGDPRQDVMSEVLRTAQSQPKTPSLASITPTTHPVRESSLYAPWST